MLIGVCAMTVSLQATRHNLSPLLRKNAQPMAMLSMLPVKVDATAGKLYMKTENGDEHLQRRKSSPADHEGLVLYDS